MSEEIYEVSSTTPNLHTELARQLEALVPEAIADGKVDIAKLKELLGDDVQDEGERFGLFWPGKKRALRAAQAPTTATLRPDRDNSKDWDTTQNVFIEGDNLEVLKILQKHYHSKIKMIYIDPPYNTGTDFVYPDDFSEGLDSYLVWTHQVNEEGKKLSTNSETDGRYHSNWLNMMYPRLKLARNLLTDDGVIFISIDDAEQSNLRKICDEIFGEKNFVATICHKSRGSVSNDKLISPNHNFVLLYARHYERLFADRKLVGLDPVLTGFDLTDDKGAYKLVPVDGPGGARKGNPYYEFFGVTGYFRYSKETMQTLYDSGEIVKRGNTLQRKYYLEKAKLGRKVDTTWWDDAGYTSSATSALKALLGGNYFDSPKPVSLLVRMIKQFVPADDSIVLDFFAGSGTTGHAVMFANAEDGGSRRFVEVQLPEPIPEHSEAREAGFTAISQITRKRTDCAGASILREQSQKLDVTGVSIDIGFKAFYLADTNFSKWQVASNTSPDKLEQTLLSFSENSGDQATPEGVLLELLIKLGFSLTEKIAAESLGDLNYFSVGEGALVAYLDVKLKPTLDQIHNLLNLGPAKFIILEDAFQGDDELKTNLKQICKTKTIELWTA